MAIAIFPQKWTNKPTGRVEINRGHPLSNKLTGCWQFSEQGGFRVQDIAGNNDCLLGSGVTWSVLGGDPGAKFSSNRALVGDAASSLLNFTSDCSLQVGVNIQTLTSTRGIASKRQVSNDNGYAISIGSAVDFSFPFFSAADGSATTGAFISLSTNKWYQVTGTRKGSVNSIYVNGIFINNNSGGSGDHFADSSNARLIFADIYDLSAGFYCLCTIAYARTWNRALTPDEAEWIYRDPYVILQPQPPVKFFMKKAAAGGGATPINAVMTEDMNL